MPHLNSVSTVGGRGLEEEGCLYVAWVFVTIWPLSFLYLSWLFAGAEHRERNRKTFCKHRGNYQTFSEDV